MSHASFRDQVVLVTGASSGIGEALARELATRGARLALVARRTERLDPLAAELAAGAAGDGGAIALTCDVTKEGDPERAVQGTLARFGRLDVVVANAGFSVGGPVERLTIDDFRRQFETNVFGVLRTLYASLDALKQSRGCFAIVGSVNAYFALPSGAPYAMSKFAVRALAETLSVELRRHGIAVVLLNPGFIESEIRHLDNQGRHIDGADPAPAWMVMDARTAAAKMARAIAARRREANITGHGKLAILIARHAPRISHLLARAIAKRDPRERLIARKLGD